MAPADTMLAAAYYTRKLTVGNIWINLTLFKKKNGVQKTRIPTVHVLN